MSYADIAEQLPAGVDVSLISGHVSLRSTRPSALGEIHLVLHDGALLVLSRKSALKPMEPVSVDLAVPMELVQDDRFAHGLRLVTSDGKTHTLRINEDERQQAAKLLLTLPGATPARARQISTRLPTSPVVTVSTPERADPSESPPSRDIALTALDNVFIAVPWGRPTIELVDSIQRGVEGLATRTRKPVALLLVVLQETRVPEDKTRKAARAMFNAIGDHLAAMAVVFDGTGFAVAAKRSIFSLVSSKMLGSIERKIFKDADTAAIWLTHAASANGCVCPPAGNVREAVEQEIARIRSASAAS